VAPGSAERWSHHRRRRTSCRPRRVCPCLGAGCRALSEVEPGTPRRGTSRPCRAGAGASTLRRRKGCQGAGSSGRTRSGAGARRRRTVVDRLDLVRTSRNWNWIVKIKSKVCST
jgi:hypothetical protein